MYIIYFSKTEGLQFQQRDGGMGVQNTWSDGFSSFLLCKKICICHIEMEVEREKEDLEEYN